MRAFYELCTDVLIIPTLIYLLLIWTDTDIEVAYHCLMSYDLGLFATVLQCWYLDISPPVTE